MTRGLQWRFFGFAGILCMCLVLIGCSRKKNATPGGSLYERSIGAIGRHDNDEADSLLHQAIVRDSETHDSQRLVQDLLLHGFVLEQMGQYDSVIPCFVQAISVTHDNGDKALERQAKQSLGEFLLAARQYSRASTAASDAATLSTLLSDWKNAYEGLEIARAAQHGMGKYSAESSTLDTLSQIDREWLGNIHTIELLEARFILLRSEKLLNELEIVRRQWIAAASEAKDTLELAKAYYSWGDFEAEGGKHESAIESYLKALSIVGHDSGSVLRAEILSSLGNASLGVGTLDVAAKYYEQALEQARVCGNVPLSQALEVQQIACGWLLRSRKSPDIVALDQNCEREIKAIAESGCEIVLPYALFLRGKIAERKGELLLAQRTFQEAVRLFEQQSILGEKNIISSLIAAFMRREGTGWYEAPLSILCSSGNLPDAFELMERWNSSDLADFFLQLPIVSRDSTYIPVTQKIQWNYAAHLFLQRELYREFSRGIDIDRERIRKLQQSEADSNLFSDQRGNNYLGQLPEGLQLLFNGAKFALHQVQDSLGVRDAVVMYVPLSNALYSIVIRHDTSLIRKSNIDAMRLGSLMDDYGNLLGAVDSVPGKVADRRSGDRISSLASTLYSYLISPIQSVLGKTDKVYFVQSKAMGWLPLHTLKRDGSFVAAKYRVRYLPSVEALFLPSVQSKPVSSVSGIGHPGRSGWDVEYELKDIRSFYNDAKMYFDTAATLAHIGSPPLDVLQICSELTVRRDIPERSTLVLSDGVSVTGLRDVPLGEVFTLPAPRTLLFSNISSVPGGMTRYAPMAFLVNGSASVIGTMWQGDRKMKKVFGEEFYTNLLTGLSSAEAYDRAEKKLASDKEFSPPWRWGMYYYFGK